MQPDEFQRVFNLPFAEAASWFRQKLNIPTKRWDELKAEAYAKAFTSAGAVQADLLADLRKICERAIAGEMDIREFRREFRPMVKKYGWKLKGGGPGWRSDLIWRTNIRNAYQAGRWQQFEEAGITHLKYIHSDGVMHPRPKHLALDGTVLPIDDPFWTVNYPPNGFGCKCMAYPASKEEIADAGESPEPPENWQNAPDAGWDYNVALAGKKRHEELLGEKLASLPPDIAAALFRELSGRLAKRNDAAFAGWVDDILANRMINKEGKEIIRTTGEEKTVWFIEPDIAEKLTELGIEMSTRLITISDRKALHSLHLEDLGKNKGRDDERIISSDDLKRLPALLREPKAVLYHNAANKKGRGVVYVFDAPTEEKERTQGLWAIHLGLTNKKTGRVANAIRSGAYIAAHVLKNKHYVLLKGTL